MCLTEPLCLNSSAGTSVPLWVAEWFPVGAVCSADFGTCQGSVPRGERSRCPVTDRAALMPGRTMGAGTLLVKLKRVSCCSSPRASRATYRAFYDPVLCELWTLSDTERAYPFPVGESLLLGPES